MGLSWQLALMSLAAGIAGNFQLGYLASVLSQPYVQIEAYINSSWTERSGAPISVETQSNIMAALNIVNPIAQMLGQMVALYICDRLGRKKTALFGCLLIFPGCLLSFGAKFFHPIIELLFVGRLIWSIADGILVVNQTIWLIEAAPAKYRGRVSSMQEVFASLGGLTTQAFGVIFSTDELWPLMFVFPMVINIFCMVAFFVVHESPHFLLFKRGAPDEARKAIAGYHGITDEKLIEQQLDIVQMNGASTADTKEQKKVNGMDTMFRPWKANDDVSKVLRHGAWIGVMVKIAFVFSATRVFRAYGTYVLESMGGWSATDARWASLGIGILRLPATLVPVFFIDRIGRRPLLIHSTDATVFCLILLMVSTIIGESWKIGTLTGAILLQTVNVIGLGSLSRFYGAELVPRKLLLKSVSTLAILEALVRIVPEYTFYTFTHSIGGYYFIVFIIPTIFFLFLIWYYCPETKGRSVNEVLNDMARRKGIDVTFHVAGDKPKKVSGAAVIPVGEQQMKQAFEEDEKKSNNDEIVTNVRKRSEHNKKVSFGVETQPSETLTLRSHTVANFDDLPIVVALRQWGLDVTTSQRNLTLNRCVSSPV